MYYINHDSFSKLTFTWKELIHIIEETTRCIDAGDYAQPIKPYLRFKDTSNRIIAMPAYVGGKFDVAGIKWIASFPNNVKKGMSRAHCVVVLNDSNTGEPVCIINTAELSVLRTSAVSGCVLKQYLKRKTEKSLKVGIIGFGPIGKAHLQMAMAMLKNYDVQYYIYDINGVDASNIQEDIKRVEVVATWQEAYQDCDIVMTCTVSEDRYINIVPKEGALLLNVSLRDYKCDIYDAIKYGIIVDSWEEVCRENTDIELFYNQCGLQKHNVYHIVDVVCRNILDDIEKEQRLMFNPMGMSAYDIALGWYIWKKARAAGVEIELQ